MTNLVWSGVDVHYECTACKGRTVAKTMDIGEAPVTFRCPSCERMNIYGVLKRVAPVKLPEGQSATVALWLPSMKQLPIVPMIDAKHIRKARLIPSPMDAYERQYAPYTAAYLHSRKEVGANRLNQHRRRRIPAAGRRVAWSKAAWNKIENRKPIGQSLRM